MAATFEEDGADSAMTYRGGPDDPERQRAFEIIQTALAGVPVLSAIGALCSSLAFATAFATDDFDGADRLVDRLVPDIKSHIRLNADEIAEAKTRMHTMVPGRA